MKNIKRDFFHRKMTCFWTVVQIVIGLGRKESQFLAILLVDALTSLISSFHQMNIEQGKIRWPTTWARFQCTSIVMKTIMRGVPVTLHGELISNSFIERRKPSGMKFYNKANLRIRRQALPNRCDYLNEQTFDWTDELSDDVVRVNLKKHYNLNKKTWSDYLHVIF